jgi:hypothetical protein
MAAKMVVHLLGSHIHRSSELMFLLRWQRPFPLTGNRFVFRK